MEINAYLEITMHHEANRPVAAKVYAYYRVSFLDPIEGALTKESLIREDDVQVIHSFDSVEYATAYLNSILFNDNVANGLKTL